VSILNSSPYTDICRWKPKL